MTNSIPTGGTTGGAGRHAAALARVLPAIGGIGHRPAAGRAQRQRLHQRHAGGGPAPGGPRNPGQRPAPVLPRPVHHPWSHAVARPAAGRRSPAGLPARRRRDADAGPGGAARRALGPGHGQPGQGADHEPGLRGRGRPDQRAGPGGVGAPGPRPHRDCPAGRPAAGRPGPAVRRPGPRPISACSGWSRRVATRAITGSSGGRWPSTCGSRWPAWPRPGSATSSSR